MQNLVKIGRSAAELLRISDFQNSGGPPSWIWYDVIADHQRLAFDGPNILLKVHIDLFILCKISRILYRPVCLEIGVFWSVLVDITQMNSDIVATLKRTVLG